MSIFIDLEMNTTDARLVHKKDLRNEVIEIGAVRMDDTFHPLDRFRIFVRPQYNGVIERKIYKLTGISNGAVSDAVSLPEALDALEAWCGSDGCEIYAWSTSDLCQLRKECGFKGIDSVFLDEMVQWHDFQEDFRQMLGEKNILSLSNAMHRAGLPARCFVGRLQQCPVDGNGSFSEFCGRCGKGTGCLLSGSSQNAGRASA